MSGTSLPPQYWAPIAAPAVEERLAAALRDDVDVGTIDAVDVGLDLISVLARLHAGAQTAFSARYWACRLERTQGALELLPAEDSALTTALADEWQASCEALFRTARQPTR